MNEHPDTGNLRFAGVLRKLSDGLEPSNRGYHSGSGLGWPLRLVAPSGLLAWLGQTALTGEEKSSQEIRAVLVGGSSADSRSS
jgi:hypothetical protein